MTTDTTITTVDQIDQIARDMPAPLRAGGLDAWLRAGDWAVVDEATWLAADTQARLLVQDYTESFPNGASTPAREVYLAGPLVNGAIDPQATYGWGACGMFGLRRDLFKTVCAPAHAAEIARRLRGATTYLVDWS